MNRYVEISQDCVLFICGDTILLDTPEGVFGVKESLPLSKEDIDSTLEKLLNESPEESDDPDDANFLKDIFLAHPDQCNHCKR